MYCPFCNQEETKVIDSRLVSDGKQVRRRRECVSCNERFTTFETVEIAVPRIVKRDGRRSPFDEEKLRISMMKALEKRSVSIDAIEASIAQIIHQIRLTGEREIPAQLVGELVMSELKVLDRVAYVRFASVYRSFQDVNAFREEISRLEEEDVNNQS